MANAQWQHALFLLFSILLDIAANFFLKKSDGFRIKTPGVIALCLVGMAFLSLTQAVKSIDLSVAYATWGAGGIIGTVLVDRYCFNQRISKQSKMGIPLLMGGVLILQFTG